MTLDAIIGQIELRITGGRPSVDTPLIYKAMVDQVDTARAAFFHRDFANVKSANIPPGFLVKEDCVSVLAEKPQCFGDCCANYTLQLSSSVMDLNEDAGLISVYLCEPNLHFSKTRAAEIRQFGASRFVRPGSNRPFFYRVGQKVYLLAGQRDLTNCKFTVVYMPGLKASASCKEVQGSVVDYPAPDYMLEEIINYVVDVNLKSFGLLEEDLKTDGKATT